MRYCLRTCPNHIGCFAQQPGLLTALLSSQVQRFTGCVWTTKLLLEQAVTVSSGCRQQAGRQAMPDLGQGLRSLSLQGLSRRMGQQQQQGITITGVVYSSMPLLLLS